MKIRLLITALMVAIATSLSACSMPSWPVEKQPDLSPRYSGKVLEAVDQTWGRGGSYKAVRVLFEDGAERSLTCTNDIYRGNYLCPYLKVGDNIGFNLKMQPVLFGDSYESDQIAQLVRFSTTEK